MITGSFNEWDPLLEVVVGDVRNAQQMAFEPSLGAYFPPDDQDRNFAGAKRNPSDISDAQYQLDNLAEILDKLGVSVKRPLIYPGEARVATPDFAVPFGNSYACPRDVLFVVGDLIVEAPMAQRGRFFEYRGYRELLKRHFRRGGRWVACPKPLLDSQSFAENYTTEVHAYEYKDHPVLLTDDPCFDAASFTRCGKDIFWQPDMVSNEMGANWLQSVIGSDFRIHKLEFEDRYPQHIDTTLVPLRPKLALTNPERPAKTGQLDIFKRSGWQLVNAPPSVRLGLPAPARDVSNWISMNLLVVDPETILIEQAEKPLKKVLESLSFRVIGVPFDKVYQFGGGLHCCTVDLSRDGSLESYFHY